MKRAPMRWLHLIGAVGLGLWLCGCFYATPGVVDDNEQQTFALAEGRSPCA